MKATKQRILLVLTAAWLAWQGVAPAPTQARDAVRLGPPTKVGVHTVRIAFKPTDLEWLGTQQYFMIDGRKVPLPPAVLGYDRIFSAPGWVVERGAIVGVRFWQFDRATSRRRAVFLSFPAYKLIRRDVWRTAPGGDTVPDPPR